MADTVKVPVGITPEGVVIDVTLDAAKYELVRRAVRHAAFTEAEQAIRLEAVTELSPREHQGLRRALRIVTELRERDAS